MLYFSVWDWIWFISNHVKLAQKNSYPIKRKRWRDDIILHMLLLFSSAIMLLSPTIDNDETLSACTKSNFRLRMQWNCLHNLFSLYLSYFQSIWFRPEWKSIFQRHAGSIKRFVRPVHDWWTERGMAKDLYRSLYCLIIKKCFKKEVHNKKVVSH